MNARTHVYPAGTAIAFESGEYSDRGLQGVVVTMKELDLAKAIEEHKAEAQAAFVPSYDGDEWRADHGAFVSWLVVKEYAFPASMELVHIGSYGELEL